MQPDIFVHRIRDDRIAAGIRGHRAQPGRHGIESVRDARRAAVQFEQHIIIRRVQRRAHKIDVDRDSAAIQHAARAAQNHPVARRARGAGVQIKIRLGPDGVGEIARDGVRHARRTGTRVRATGHSDVAGNGAAAAQRLRTGQRQRAAGQRGHVQRSVHGVAGSIGGRCGQCQSACPHRGRTAVAQRAAECQRAGAILDEAQRAAARTIRQRAGEGSRRRTVHRQRRRRGRGILQSRRARRIRAGSQRCDRHAVAVQVQSAVRISETGSRAAERLAHAAKHQRRSAIQRVRTAQSRHARVERQRPAKCVRRIRGERQRTGAALRQADGTAVVHDVRANGHRAGSIILVDD